MTENLPVLSNNVIKSRLKLHQQWPTDVMVCIILSLGLVALLSKPLADVEMMGWWWGFFIVCNIAYIIHGMKKGWAKGDPANGLVIVAGPIPFYFWAFLGVWRKYHVYKKDGYGWTLQKLERNMVENDLTQGFDFEFLAKHKGPVRRLLKSCKLCIEDVLDEAWLNPTDGKHWYCFSVTDTKENMIMREAGR